jgi:hypothetical protein
MGNILYLHTKWNRFHIRNWIESRFGRVVYIGVLAVSLLWIIIFYFTFKLLCM